MPIHATPVKSILTNSAGYFKFSPLAQGGVYSIWVDKFGILNSLAPQFNLIGTQTVQNNLDFKLTSIQLILNVVGINSIVFGVCFGFMATHSFLLPIICTGLIFISCVGAYLNARPN